LAILRYVLTLKSANFELGMMLLKYHSVAAECNTFPKNLRMSPLVSAFG